jgi:hypothetical protein
MCKQTFTPGPIEALPVAGPADLPSAYQVQSDEPAPRRAYGPDESPGRAFAERAGIDLDEFHQIPVLSEEEAKGRLDEWHEAMPEVPSAYQPSGKMPGQALAAMLISVPFAGLGGGLAFVVVGGIVAALTLGISALHGWMADTCGCVLCILIILGFAVGILGGALTCGVLGWAAAAITTGAGMVGNNRNTTAAVVISLVSCALALGLSHFVGGWLLTELLDWYQPGLLDASWMPWVRYGGEIVGGLIALLVAGWTAQNMVQESKFCEDCEKYMEEETRRGLHLGPARALTRALAEGDFEAAADLMSSREGKSAVPTLFWCAKCGKGYLEVQAKFQCTWKKDNEDEELEEEWLAASAAMEPEQVDLFRQRRRGGREYD